MVSQQGKRLGHKLILGHDRPTRGTLKLRTKTVSDMRFIGPYGNGLSTPAGDASGLPPINVSNFVHAFRLK